ncbi:3-keto-5-aminohexanoate cleavage protein, partial [Streptococcus pseudopneumoniae]|uniref:3-keto-5-aminohexanoate cleavage protein n=1 Tax=Streptococcus pseudopneumoniae TaxID=257758 RepID=UPI001BB0F46F
LSANQPEERTTMNPTIISCAVTGSFPTREHNPALPVTPAAIADACTGAAKAGAAICHIHVRDPETGVPRSLELLRRAFG